MRARVRPIQWHHYTPGYPADVIYTDHLPPEIARELRALPFPVLSKPTYEKIAYGDFELEDIVRWIKTELRRICIGAHWAKMNEDASRPDPDMARKQMQCRSIRPI